MKLIVVSGLSGSGKTVALQTLEDEDYYCVDNLPPMLLPSLVQELKTHSQRVAIGIDARSNTSDLSAFLDHLQQLCSQNIATDVIFLHADTEVLLKRFSETRRRHPLSQDGLPLIEAIAKEHRLLSGIQERADLVIDTTRSNIHDLRKLLIERLGQRDGATALSILFQSFGFKHGVPADSDFIFDVRCLPNPHWVASLRPLTGKDTAVIEFLQQQPLVNEMLNSIQQFLQQWLPHYAAEKRRYITISIGCSGGQHRSVYLCQQLAVLFSQEWPQLSLRHRDLP